MDHSGRGGSANRGGRSRYERGRGRGGGLPRGRGRGRGGSHHDNEPQAAEVTEDFKNWIDGVLETFSNTDEQRMCHIDKTA